MKKESFIYNLWNLAAPFGLLAATPFYLYGAARQERFRTGLGQRLTLELPDKSPAAGRGPRIWMHAASVGEVLTALSFGALLRESWPAAELTLSTLTPTGRDTAVKRAKFADRALLLPLDWSPLVKRLFSRLQPELLVVAETEIWPNLLREAKRAGAVTILVNGRISERSFKRYRLVKSLLRPILEHLDYLTMQSPADAERIVAMGAPAGRVHVLGNFKFDLPPETGSPLTHRDLGLNPQAPLLVAGSTHPGEEEIILNVYLRLRESRPNLNLILAPRHRERFAPVAEMVRKAGEEPVLRSKLNDRESFNGRVMLLDTLGELSRVYRLADVVFMGGSLVPIGGHNLLEAAIHSRPAIYGPHMENFREIAEAMQTGSAAIQVENEEQLEREAARLFSSPEERQERGAKAAAILDAHRGAARRTLAFLKDRLSGKPSFAV